MSEAEEHLILGQSRATRDLRRDIELVAATDSTVLINGETGTGKGLVARAIHQESRRRDRPFVHVDCASLPESVIESELFGHERGAFTNAHEKRIGRFEMAERGSVFLDEIGELEPRIQAKLLRVLQDREFERVGGNRTMRLEARVIAATNRNLRAAVDAREFRADLFFRLNVAAIRVRSLRERTEDLRELVEHRIEQIARREGIAKPELDPSFLAVLVEYTWPGNVRELFNALERILIFCRDERLFARHAARFVAGIEDSGGESSPETPRRVSPTATFGSWGALPVADRDDPGNVDRIAAALSDTGGNVARAARRLKVPRSTLRYRIRTHALEHLIPAD